MMVEQLRNLIHSYCEINASTMNELFQGIFQKDFVNHTVLTKGTRGAIAKILFNNQDDSEYFICEAGLGVFSSEMRINNQNIEIAKGELTEVINHTFIHVSRKEFINRARAKSLDDFFNFLLSTAKGSVV